MYYDLFNVGDSSVHVARLQAAQPGDVGYIPGTDCGFQNCFAAAHFPIQWVPGTLGNVAWM
jgi:hypothetical protein